MNSMRKVPDDGRSVPSLNEAQLRRLLISCEHMDKLLANIEEILNTSKPKLAFPKYSDDLSPAQHKRIQEFISRFRAQLTRVVAGQGIQHDKPKIAASHAIQAALTFVEIAVEDLRPEKMRGYGQVSEAGIVDLNAVVQELHDPVQQLQRYLLQHKELDP